MSNLDWTGISYPFRIENGSVAISKSKINSKDGLSEHISESIQIIITTTLGEWLTKANIGTKLRRLSFNVFSEDFDAYLIHVLVTSVETQDQRVKIKDISIDRNDKENTATVKVKWDINEDIVQIYNTTNEYTTEVIYDLDGTKGGEE